MNCPWSSTHYPVTLDDVFSYDKILDDDDDFFVTTKKRKLSFVSFSHPDLLHSCHSGKILTLAGGEVRISVVRLQGDGFVSLSQHLQYLTNELHPKFDKH